MTLLHALGPAAIAVVVALFAVAFVQFHRARSSALMVYWRRTCAGRTWHRAFPDASTPQIRQYLHLFAESFAFPVRRALRFEPTDRIYAVYRALYPDSGWPDALELETLSKRLQTSYGLELRVLWREDLTLGEVFAQIYDRAT